MIVFAFIILLILVLWNHVNSMPDGIYKEHSERTCFLFICGILVVLAGIRGREVGTDTISYIYDYDFVCQSTFEQIQKRFEVSSGYYIISKLFSLTGLGVQWWFGAVELLFLYSLFKFSTKFATDKLFCLFCAVTVGLYFFTLAGLKQTMGMSFGLLAYVFFVDKRYIWFAILATIAFWCHHVTAIMAICIITYIIRNYKQFKIIVLPLLFGSMLLGDLLWTSMITGIEDEHYMMYIEADNTYSATTYIFYIVIFLMTLLPYRKYHKDRTGEARVFYTMFALAIVFQSLATSFSSAFRIAYCFLPFMCALIPNSLQYVSNRQQRIQLRFLYFVFFTIWTLYTKRYFSFTYFWNND